MAQTFQHRFRNQVRVALQSFQLLRMAVERDQHVADHVRHGLAADQKQQDEL